MYSFKCITGIVSGNPLAVIVLTSPKSSLNLRKSTFILLFHLSEPNWVWKILFLIRFQIIWLLVDKLTATYEYSRTNRENLPLLIQIKLSKKTIKLFLYFLTFFEIYIKFSMFWNKHQLHRSNISEIIDSKRCAYFNA